MKATLYTVLCIAIRLGSVLMVVNVLGEMLYALLQVGLEAFTADTLLTGVFALLMAAAMWLWLWPGLLAWWVIGGASTRSTGKLDYPGTVAIHRVFRARHVALHLQSGLLRRTDCHHAGDASPAR